MSELLTPDEAVAEMQRHLNAGVVGWHGLASAEQMSYRDAWWSLCEWITEQRNRNHDEFLRLADVQQKINDLANHGAPSMPPPTAINTTFHGRTAYEDHAPR